MRKIDSIQFLPTISWAAFYVAPLFLLSRQSADLVSSPQIFGAMVILVALGVGDTIASWTCMPSVSGTVPRQLVLLLTAIVALSPVAHIAIAGELPILKIILGYPATATLLAREHFNKEIPTLLAHLFQHVLTVFGPVLFGVLVLERQNLHAGVVFFWCMTYALASGAKWPALIFFFTAALIVISTRGRRWGMVFPLLALVAGIMFYFAADRLSSSLTGWANRGGAIDRIAELKQYGPVSAGDIHRLNEAQGGPSGFGRSADYLIYRVYMGPVEVASRWYEFFPSVYGSYLGLDGIFGPTTYGRTPSNIIGSEVYRKRFPDRYLDSASAYASIDADAHAHWGPAGILFAAICLLLIRACSQLGATTPLGSISQAAQLAILTTVPFQGSIQAIVVSQGIWALLLLQVASVLSAQAAPFAQLPGKFPQAVTPPKS